MIYRPHPSHPGFGWIEPVMNMDDPLIVEYVAQALIAFHQQQIEAAYESGADNAVLIGYGGNIE